MFILRFIFFTVSKLPLHNQIFFSEPAIRSRSPCGARFWNLPTGGHRQQTENPATKWRGLSGVERFGVWLRGTKRSPHEISATLGRLREQVASIWEPSNYLRRTVQAYWFDSSLQTTCCWYQGYSRGELLLILLKNINFYFVLYHKLQLNILISFIFISKIVQPFFRSTFLCFYLKFYWRMLQVV